MIEHMLHLERELSSFDGYEGWVIGKASFHIEKKKGQDKTDRKKLRDTSRLAILEIQRSDIEYQGTLQVTLVLPGKDRIKNTERSASDTEQAKYKRSIIFDQEQVDAYLEETRDCNPVHKGRNAIVPGFLMVNKIVEEYRDFLEVKKINPQIWEIHARFQNAVKVGEVVQIEDEMKDKKLIITGTQGNVDCFVISVDFE